MGTIVEILMMNFYFRVTGISIILRKQINPKWRWKLIKNYYTETRFAAFELRIVNSVKACIASTLEKSSTNTTVAFSRLFICFESRPNSFYACPFCGRYLGCFSCLSKVDKCPMCRKKFSCLKCTGILPRNPLFIPDIEKLVDIPQTRSNALKSPAESEDSEDTLPVVGFNQATQPTSANTNL